MVYGLWSLACCLSVVRLPTHIPGFGDGVLVDAVVVVLVVDPDRFVARGHGIRKFYFFLILISNDLVALMLLPMLDRLIA